VNYVKADGFGAATSPGDFQFPRAANFSFGVRF
jgi:hypothetical protein